MVVLQCFNGPYHTVVLLHGLVQKEQEHSTNTLKCPKDVVTTKDFNKAKEEWLKKKQNPIKAQEDLKDHIEKKK